MCDQSEMTEENEQNSGYVIQKSSLKIPTMDSVDVDSDEEEDADGGG